MEVSPERGINPATVCEWCLNVGTSRCGRCHAVFYCCRDHQVAHWAIHKKSCKKILPDVAPAMSLNPSINVASRIDNIPPQGNWCQNNMPLNSPVNANVPMEASNIYNADSLTVQGKSADFQINEDEIFSSLSSEYLSSDNNFWDLINSCDAQNFFAPSEDPEKDKAIAKISESLQETASAYLKSSDSKLPEETLNLMQCAPFNDICENIVHDLNKYGICVLDNFIGSAQGTLILNEVKNLYCKGIFTKGELVNPNPYMVKENVRSDVTTWVNGTEPDCSNIGSLMRKLDAVVTTCNKFNNNGILSRYKLHRRTKAMIACYPGDGTHYKKHIDNPHKDGRCITCIYYLNKDWNIEEHGGLLRMFPVADESQIANIEPIFDRMIFFWSDKRNPHEVLPSYQTRFAITVWYFDADERDQALMMVRDKTINQLRMA
ncbi:egl nine homolog 1 [Nephila pilipes]|uniref:hypoxia-inducible factor-proline dioxygenase n=1 Tax=Nephila pilipes TaxID=299642 RepID=A0A8X6TVB8_NEPPI|nr:egl nine homolog 1 [Nephila pilipes]